MANPPGQKSWSHGGPHGGLMPKRNPGGGPGAASSGNDQGRVREITEALRPPEKPPEYFAPNSRALRPALLDSEAQQTARGLAAIPASQLRRFYSEVMALKRRLELTAEQITDDEVRAQMALLKAKAAYTCRRQKDYPVELVRFFTRHAAAVRGRDDFRQGFQPHFEAVMAYHKAFEPEKKDRGEG